MEKGFIAKTVQAESTVTDVMTDDVLKIEEDIFDIKPTYDLYIFICSRRVLQVKNLTGSFYNSSDNKKTRGTAIAVGHIRQAFAKALLRFARKTKFASTLNLYYVSKFAAGSCWSEELHKFTAEFYHLNVEMQFFAIFHVFDPKKVKGQDGRLILVLLLS